MNGFDLAGRPIRVGLGNDKFTPDSANLMNRYQGQGGNRGMHGGGSVSNFDRAGGRDDKGASSASALDDTDVAGVNFNNYSRDALMRKLARTDEPEPTVDEKRQMLKPKTETKPLPVNVNMASRCVVLRNMFDPAEYVSPSVFSLSAFANDVLGRRVRTGSRSWRRTSALSAKKNMATLFTLL